MSANVAWNPRIVLTCLLMLTPLRVVGADGAQVAYFDIEACIRMDARLEAFVPRLVEAAEQFDPVTVWDRLMACPGVKREDANGVRVVVLTCEDKVSGRREIASFSRGRLLGATCVERDGRYYAIRFHRNRRLKHYMEWQEGRGPDGIGVEFHDNGRLQRFARFQGGSYVGVERAWDQAGVLTQETRYVEPKPVTLTPVPSAERTIRVLVEGPLFLGIGPDTEDDILREGQNALAPLEGGVRGSTGRMRARLVHVVGRVGGGRAAALLAEWALAGGDPDLRRVALWEWAHAVSGTPPRGAESQAVLGLLRSGDAFEAACASLLLGSAPRDGNDVAALVAARYQQAVGQAFGMELALELSHVPPRYAVLGCFLEALTRWGAPGREALETLTSSWPEVEDAAAWRVLALGAAGDREQTDAVRETVTGAASPYLRAVAVPVYARLAGASAVPLLRELRRDEVLYRYGSQYEERQAQPIREAAERALAELGGK